MQLEKLLALDASLLSKEEDTLIVKALHVSYVKGRLNIETQPLYLAVSSYHDLTNPSCQFGLSLGVSISNKKGKLYKKLQSLRVLSNKALFNFCFQI